LVLGGDICVAADLLEQTSPDLKYGHAGIGTAKSRKIHDFFSNCCAMFPHVVYVAGNHEHYHYDFKYTISHLKKMLGYLPNLHILEKETIELNGVAFVGGTLWTDMNRSDPLTLHYVKGAMNDFREVLNSNRMVTRKVPIYEENPLWTADGKNGSFYTKGDNGAHVLIGYKDKTEPARFCPEDSVEEHDKMLKYIDYVSSSYAKIVVVGHHAPSSKSVAYYYSHDTLMNGAFRSELDEFIMNKSNRIKLWVHGHMHNKSDYMIGDTRVVCNPRGYIGHEKCADEFKLQYVEV
jgi:hypothetical protein